MEAKSVPEVIFGVPKANILRSFRTFPWLPRRIANSTVFYGEIAAFAGRRIRFSSFRLQSWINISVKIAALAGLHRFAASRRGSQTHKNAGGFHTHYEC